MTKRIATGLLLAVFILVMAVSLTGVALAAPAQQATPQPPYPSWAGNFTVSNAVPFLWIRSAPSSVATVLTSLQPGTAVTASTPRNQLGQVWDGVQWWGYVIARGVAGWVEIKSLQGQGVPPTSVPPTAPANQTPAPWPVNGAVRVRAQVPFVWLRQVPASDAPILLTVMPGTQLTLVGNPVSDNRQWWWQVRDTRGTVGWVEQNSLEAVQVVPTATSVPTIAPGQWRIGDILRIKAGIPFAWLRNSPSSTGGIVYTTRPGQQVLVLSGPQNDGVQNWWVVQVVNSPVGGWVEENSLEFVRRP